MSLKILVCLLLALSCRAVESGASFGLVGESTEYSYEIAWLGSVNNVAGIMVWAKDNKDHSGIESGSFNGVHKLKLSGNVVNDGRVMICENGKARELNEVDSKVIYDLIRKFGMKGNDKYHQKVQEVINRTRG